MYDRQVDVTRSLIKFCLDHDNDTEPVRLLESCLQALETDDVVSALNHFRSIPLGGMGCFNDWLPPPFSNGETQSSAAAMFKKLLNDWVVAMKSLESATMKTYYAPYEQQCLTIQGILHADVLASVFKNLDAELGGNRLCVFVSYAYDDIPIGTTFDVIMKYRRPDGMIQTSMVLEFVTQEFSYAWDEIPRGWKTVCVLGFPDGIPQIFLNLPIAQHWHEHPLELALCICKKEVAEAVAEYLVELEATMPGKGKDPKSLAGI